MFAGSASGTFLWHVVSNPRSVSAQSVAGELTATGITLVDKDGKKRAWLGVNKKNATEFSIMDESEAVWISMGAGKGDGTGEAALEMSVPDGQRQPSLSFGVTKATGTADLSLMGQGGKSLIALDAHTKGNRISLISEKDESGKLLLTAVGMTTSATRGAVFVTPFAQKESSTDVLPEGSIVVGFSAKESPNLQITGNGGAVWPTK